MALPVVISAQANSGGCTLKQGMLRKKCPVHGHGEAYYGGRLAEALFLARRLLFASARTSFGALPPVPGQPEFD